MESEYLKMIENLAIVLSVLFMLMYVVKKLRTSRVKLDQHIKIIHTVSIGTKERILLMTVNNKTLLIGATPNHIETLHVFNEDASVPVAGELPVIKADTFSEVFSSVR